MKQYKMINMARQKGFTLIESIVVLAIAGLILAGAAWGINKAFGSNDIKDTNTALTTVMSALPDLRTASGYGDPGTNLVPALIAQNAIPSVWTINAGVPQNAWDGMVSVSSQVSYATITLTKVPQEACNKLVTKISRGSNFKNTQINGGQAITGEVKSATALAQCTSDNTITWSTLN